VSSADVAGDHNSSAVHKAQPAVTAIDLRPDPLATDREIIRATYLLSDLYTWYFFLHFALLRFKVNGKHVETAVTNGNKD
jgi:hypothetical protein